MNDGMPDINNGLNNGLGKLDRINQWWNYGLKAKISGMIEEYFLCLEAIYNESCPYFSETEQVEVEKTLDNIKYHLAAQHRRYPLVVNWVEMTRHNALVGCDKLARRLSTLLHAYGLEKLKDTDVLL